MLFPSVGGYMLGTPKHNSFHIIFPPILRSLLWQLYDIVVRFWIWQLYDIVVQLW